MDLKKFKLGVGPMSKEIIEVLNSYNKNLMVIASRNQVDYDSGYVCKTASLQFSNPNIITCRDHCGPYFSEKDYELNLKQAIEECKKTIINDIKNNISIIHIDVSKIKQDLQIYYAQLLIEFAIENKTDIKLEFGSEENTGLDIEESFKRLDLQLNFASKYKKNIIYFVTQTGSLVKDCQSGVFDIEYNKKILEHVHSAGFLFKEHNADYLDEKDLQVRKNLGIDALNIAPQLGSIQSNILSDISKNCEPFLEFKKKVLEGQKYKKWIDKENYNDDLGFSVSAHYFFNSEEYVRLLKYIDYSEYRNRIKQQIEQVLDHYIDKL